jgi:Tfp pilus assembly protein PilO
VTGGRTTRSVCWPIHAVGVTVCLLLTAITVFIVGRPILVQRDVEQEIAARLADLRRRSDAVNAANARLKAKLQRVETELRTTEVSLESGDQLNVHLSRIIDLAAASSITIDESQSGGMIPGEHFDSVPLMLSGRGRYPDCARFLHHLAAEMRDVQLISLELSGPEPAVDPVCEFQLELAWYAAPTVVKAH